MNEEEIKIKLLKEQDLVCYYALNDFNKSVGIMQEYIQEPEIYYTALGKYLLEDMNLLENFKVNNLLNLLTKLPRDDIEKRKNLLEIINKKLEKEEFFIEDTVQEVFMKPYHSVYRIFNQLGKEQAGEIRERLLEKRENVKGTDVENIVSTLSNLGDISNFLKYYEEGIFSKEKIEILEEMIDKDKDALEYVNFGIFQDEIFNNVPKEFIEYISKFPNLSTQLVILQRNNPKLLEALTSKMQQYESLPDNYDEIEIFITYFTRKCFDIQLEQIDKDVLEDLSQCAMLNAQQQKYREVINIEYTAGYKQKLQEKYLEEYQKINEDEKNIKSIFFPEIEKKEYREKKKNIYLNKRFSICIYEAEKILEEYGSDLENLKGISEEDKNFFQEIKRIIDIKENADIDEMFYSCDVREYKPIEIFKLKQRIAKECALTYTEPMRNTDERIRNAINNNDENIYENIEYEGKYIKQIKLKGKFDLLVHSTDAGFINEREIDEETDFSKLWSTGKDKSNHIISMSYINQDFLGCAPVNENGVMYGFTQLPSERIKLMGVTDINTYSREFAYSSVTNKYMSAKTMPYNSRRVYNEFGVERQGTIPDYVILFDDATEAVKNNTYKAASQFDIPILYIDKREIEKQQLENLEQLIEKFDEEKSPEKIKDLINTYETNMAGWLLNRSEIEEDASHTQSIDNSRFKEHFEDVGNKIENLINQYLEEIESGGKDSNQIEDLIDIMRIVLEERDLYKGCEETKPITKTSMGLNSEKIIDKINDAFNEVGMSEYRVDMEKIPTAEEYELNMQTIIKNALSGENEINSDDIKEAEAYQQLIDKMMEEYLKEDKD